jgi:hypothetical protein
MPPKIQMRMGSATSKNDPNNPDTDGDGFPDGLDRGWRGNPREKLDSPLTRVLLIALLSLSIWTSFIAHQLPKLRQDLKQQLQRIESKTHQFQESIDAISVSKNLQELAEVSKNAYRLFKIYTEAIQDIRKQITRKWIPPFLCPDLAPLETLATSVDQAYTRFTQEYLKRVEELMVE